jgi:hypothetical protein
MRTSGPHISANYERILMRFFAFKSAPRRQQKSTVPVLTTDGGHEPEVTELRGFHIDKRPT